MQFGISIPAFADFSDPRLLAEAAHDAEAAGWDGFFIWDAMFFDPTFHPMADPWVSLAAVALSTHEWRELLAYIQKYRASTSPFDAVHFGSTPGDNATQAAELIEPYAEADVTWWVEPVDP